MEIFRKVKYFFNKIRYTIADYMLIAQYTATVYIKSYYFYGNSLSIIDNKKTATIPVGCTV